MQADLLSVTLTLGGTPVIVPSGTYTYRADQTNWPLSAPNWRRHFIGPGASNGLVIQGSDPLERRGGDFPGGARGDIKSRVVVDRQIAGTGLAWVEGEVHSETRYGGHRRGVVHVNGCYWVLVDRISQDLDARPAALHFQLAPGARIESFTDGTQRVRCGEAGLEIAASPGLGVAEVLHGVKRPPAGWVSPSYGVLQAAPLLRFPVTAAPGLYGILLAPDAGDSKGARLEIAELDHGALALRIARQDVTDILLFGGGEQGEIEAFGVRFRGKLLWLRSRSGRLVALRWLSGGRLAAPDLNLDVAAATTVAELSLIEEAGGIQVRGVARSDLSLSWPGG